jgi:hypothetical protein
MFSKDMNGTSYSAGVISRRARRFLVDDQLLSKRTPSMPLPLPLLPLPLLPPPLPLIDARRIQKCCCS